MAEPKKVNDYSYEIPQNKEEGMNVPVKIFASEKLMEHLKGDKSLEQGMNVAKLPGILGASIMMPDAHQGYGFSIGGVAAFDMETGIISPGGVGFDINCGVRLIATSLIREDVEPKIKELLNTLYDIVPSGVGKEAKERLSDDELDAIMKEGPAYLVRKGKGVQEDIDRCEANGCLTDADPSKITRKAKARGRRQLGTLGAGNHFLEIQYVEDIENPDVAKTFGITKKGQVVFMIHCGSRGLGHQVASDYLRKMEDEYPEIITNLPEKDLIYAPINSPLGKDYYAAMCAAANFAWANRHMIQQYTIEGFKKYFPEANFQLVYDVTHNIAKKEIHAFNGEEKEVMVHRKGATRAFGPGSKDLPEVYQETGQPIIIPGSMGTSSYLLVGTKEAMNVSFGSTAHGAGRVMSRFAAKKEFDGEQIKEDLEKEHIYLKVGSVKGVADEAPLAYKDVDEVIKVSHDAGIGKIVAKLKPMGVIKG